MTAPTRSWLPRAALALALLLAITGCTTPDPMVNVTRSTSSVSPESMSAKASDKAKAIVARADGGRVLTHFDLDEAAANAMDCLELAGITPGLKPPVDLAHGYSISWSYDLGDGPDPAKADQLDAIANACVDTEYYPVENAYLSQPESVEAQDAQQEKWRSQAIACLSTTVYAQDDKAEWQEVLTALTEDFLERREASCYSTLGINSTE